MTLTDWAAIVLGGIIIVGIIAIAVLKSGRHKRVAAIQRAADWREHALRRLSPDDREHFGRQWSLVEAHFIEDPRNAVAEADRVVEQLLSARGYPLGEWQTSVREKALVTNAPPPAAAAIPANPKPAVAQSYREAHEIALKQARGDAHGKELRRALLDYRLVFDNLLAAPGHERHRQNSENRDSGDRELNPVLARRNG